MAQQVRIILRDTALKRAERLQKVVEAGSITELINLMLSRYGKHLESTWEVLPKCSTYTIESSPDVEASKTSQNNNNFTFDEPLSGL